MKMLKIIAIICILAGFFLINANNSRAFTQPSFSSCLNPQMPLQVSHPDGVHGVPGDSNSYSGADNVYSDKDTLSSSSVMQCLCLTNGQGMQTNWWKASDLSEDEIKILESQGWIYIPDGSAWGLDSAPYMAQTTNFACGQATLSSSTTGGTGNGGNSSGASPSNSGSSNNSSSNSGSGSSSNSNSSQPIQSVLGAFTELANTGNIVFIYSLLLMGLIASFLALVIKKNK